MNFIEHVDHEEIERLCTPKATEPINEKNGIRIW